MHIYRLHIDRFGILAEQEVPYLSPGLSIFLGHNEAGKSTCMRFFQVALFGYKRGRSSIEPMQSKRSRGNAGGSLFLHTETLGDITLTRKPGDEVALLDHQGQPLPESALQRLYNGLTVEVFDSIFAISLKSLMDVSSLNGAGVRHALHGAAFGLGLQSPARVLKELEARMEPLLKRDHASSLITNTARQLEAIRTELHARGPDLERYTLIQHEYEEISENVASITQDAASRTQTLQTLQQLELLVLQCEERREAVVAEKKTQTALEEEIQALAPRGALAENSRLHAIIQGLREQKERCRGDAASLPALEQEIRTLEQAQHQIMHTLGESWTAEAIGKMDTSPLTVQAIDANAHALAERKEALEQAKQYHTRLATEHTEAVQQSILERNMLEEITPQALPDIEQTENLAPQLLQAEQALASLTEVTAYYQGAKKQAEYSRTAVAPHWDEAHLVHCDSSHAMHEKIREGVTAWHNARECSAAGKNFLAGAQARADAAQQQLDTVQKGIILCGVQAIAILKKRQEALEPDCNASTYHTENLTAFTSHCTIAYEAALHNEEMWNSASRAAGEIPLLEELEERRTRLRQMDRILMELRTAQSALAARMARPCIYKAFVVSLILVVLGRGLLGLSLALAIPALAYLGGVTAVAGLGLFSREFWAEEAGTTPEAIVSADIARLFSMLQAAAAEAGAWLPLAAEQDTPDEAGIDIALQELDIWTRLALTLEDHLRDFTEAQNALNAALDALIPSQNAVARTNEQQAACAAQLALLLQQAGLPHVDLLQEGAHENILTLCTRAETAKAHLHAEKSAYATLQSILQSLALPLANAETIDFFAPSLMSQRYTAESPKTLTESSIPAPSTSALPALSWYALAAHLEDPLHPFAALMQQGLATLKTALTALRIEREKQQERQKRQSTLSAREEQVHRLALRLNSAAEAMQASEAALRAQQCIWKNWLTERGLSVHLTPKEATEALAQMRSFMDLQKRITTHAVNYNRNAIALGATLKEILLTTLQIGEPISDAATVFLAGVQPMDSANTATDSIRFAHAAVTLLPEALDLLAHLAKASEDIQKSLALRTEKQKQHKQHQENLKQAQASFDATQEKLMAVLAAPLCPVALRAEITQWLTGQALASSSPTFTPELALPTVQENSIHSVNYTPLSTSSSFLPLQFDTTSLLNNIKTEQSQLEGQLHALQASITALTETQGQLKERRANLMGSDGNAPLLLKEAVLKEELHRLSRQWCVPALARHLLLTAKARFEQEGNKGVIGHASKLFADITGGEYTGMAASLDDENFRAIHKSGEARDPEKQLSQGTREQLYLALRLAYIRNHAVRAEPLPVIMDDILVNSDAKRARQCATVLAEFSKTNQLLFFTCHQHIADMLQEAGNNTQGCPPPTLLVMERGTITTAGEFVA